MAESTKKIIIGLTGENCAGKGTVADYFINKYNFDYYSLSDIIREEARARDLPESRVILQDIGNELRKTYGPSVLADRTKPKLTRNSIVDSIRNPYEVRSLQELDNFIFIAVKAPVELRYERARQRGRIENAQTLDEFIKIEQREQSTSTYGQQLAKTIAMASEYIINDKDLKHLYAQIDDILRKHNII